MTAAATSSSTATTLGADLGAALSALAAGAAHAEGPLVQADDPYFKSAAAQLRATMKRHANTGRAKNIILFVGDGMGVTTVTAARIYGGAVQVFRPKGAAWEPGAKLKHDGGWMFGLSADCGVVAARIDVLFAPTRSLAGSIQVVARVVCATKLVVQFQPPQQ